MIEGFSHIGLVVQDIELMSEFLTTIFDAKEIDSQRSDNPSRSNEKFFLIDKTWFVIESGSQTADRSRDHVAFKICHGDIAKYKARIASLGINVEEGHSRIEGESVSLYFRDYDGHLFELQTGTIERRLGLDD